MTPKEENGCEVSGLEMGGRSLWLGSTVSVLGIYLMMLAMVGSGFLFRVS